MENNLIIQDDLKTHIRSLTGMFTDDGFYVPIDAVLGAIDFAQTIDAELVRHGVWLKDKEGNTYCSCCDACIPVVHCHQDYQDDEFDWDEEIEETNYCPNCGAKMEEKTNETFSN